MSFTRPVGVACALLAACALVPALLVLGTAALLLIAFPTTGAAALVVGVAALAVPGTLTLAAGALVTDRVEGPALAVLGAAVAVAVASIGAVPGPLPVVVAIGAVLAAATLATHRPVVVTSALEGAVSVAAAALLAAHGLALLVGLPVAGPDVAVPAGVALVTAAVALGARRTAQPGVVSPFVAAAALALLSTVLAVRSDVDPLPAALATAALLVVVSHRTVVFVRAHTFSQPEIARM